MKPLILTLTLSMLLQAAPAAAAQEQATTNVTPAPPAAAAQPEGNPQTEKPAGVKIPAGTKLEIEATHTVNSKDLKKGDLISFRVMNPVVVNGVIVIEKDATATGRVTESKRGGHWGRAGRLAWAMRDVTAVDGSRVPLHSSGRLVGDSKGAKVATKTVLTGVVLWPIAPVALLHGFKRGENAQLPAGKLFEVETQAETVVRPPEPR